MTTSPDAPSDASTLEIVTRARAALDERFGVPAVTTVAPGRVNLVGGHTDYSEGFVLPVAVDRRVAVAARPREDDRIRAHSETLDETAATPIEAGEGPRWLAYLRGVAVTLRAAGHDVGGADLAVASDVPVGAGLASSAALELAAGRAMAALAEVSISPRNLATHCRTAEREVVGVDCGVMDQLTAALGRAGHALLLDCRSLDVDPISLPADDARVAVVDTTVSHELADSAYNDRVDAVERASDRLAALLDRDVETLRDVGPADLLAVGDRLDPRLRARAAHVVSENARVREAAAALRERDLETVGSLLTRSHRSLRDRYEVSCEELDAAVDAATAVDGVLGARMTGAGFGGSVVALVRPGAADRFREEVAAGYRQRTGIDPGVYVCEPADGCRIVE